MASKLTFSVLEDFEVSIYLTELSTRHSLLTKHKQFEEKPRITSNSTKLTNWLASGTSDKPHEIAEDNEGPIVIAEEEEHVVNLADVPDATANDSSKGPARRSARAGRSQVAQSLFVNDSDSEEDFFQTQQVPPRDKPKESAAAEEDDDESVGEDAENMDDKKKLTMKTEYDGFSIYGRILCLVVKRKGVRAVGATGGAAASSQQMLEVWVSTQANQNKDEEEDDDDG